MLRTKSGLPKLCGWNTDHHGKRRVRFRKGGFSTYLTGTPWSEEFMRQYAAALDGVQAQQTEIGSAAPSRGRSTPWRSPITDPPTLPISARALRRSAETSLKTLGRCTAPSRSRG